MTDACRLVVTVCGVALVTVGCGGKDGSGSGASPTGPSSPIVTDLRGTVYEDTFSGSRTLPGARIRLTLDGVPAPGNTQETVSDGNGAYVFRDVVVPYTETWSFTLLSETYVQPCGIDRGDFEFIRSVDLHVVPVDVMSAVGVPASHPRAGAFGVVVEQEGDVKRPVAGADVELWTGDQVLSRFTTGPEGQFGFCDRYDVGFGPIWWPFWLSVRKDGYRWSGFVLVQSADERHVDVTIERDAPAEMR